MSTVENDAVERRSMPYEPAGPTRSELLADEHPPFTNRTRTSGDFLADLERMRKAS